MTSHKIGRCACYENVQEFIQRKTTHEIYKKLESEQSAISEKLIIWSQNSLELIQENNYVQKKYAQN